MVIHAQNKGVQGINQPVYILNSFSITYRFYLAAGNSLDCIIHAGN